MFDSRVVGGQVHGADVLVTLSKPLLHEMLYQLQVGVNVQCRFGATLTSLRSIFHKCEPERDGEFSK